MIVILYFLLDVGLFTLIKNYLRCFIHYVSSNLFRAKSLYPEKLTRSEQLKVIENMSLHGQDIISGNSAPLVNLID